MDPDSKEIIEPQSSENAERPWQPLTSVQRRVVGVMVEKSKTTPDIYPMTVNAIKTGCNQKSNRSPQMELDAEDVSETLEDLREMGVVIEVIGDGRATKFKHRLYDWLDVDRAQLAIMAELLLRGEQSLGDLRARAARMEKIAGLDQLRPIVDQLMEKGLMVALTPAGRGQIVSHNLYFPHEIEQLMLRYREGIGKASEPETQAGPALASKTSQLTTETLQFQIAQLQERVVAIERQLSELQEKLA